MFGERISVNGKIYILGPYLASGLIGTVFPAWEDQDSQENPVKAVKVPAPNLTEDLKEKFWLEFEILNNLNKKWNELHPGVPSPFPSVEKGKKVDSTSEVLVMDYIPDEEIVSRVFVSSQDSFEQEKKYLEAALQYVQMLTVLHQADYSCPDRKTPDVRWHEERLVVLDWNVVKEAPLNEDIQQDYYLFGSMWYQFLTGKYAPTDLDVLNDEYWGGLSIGTRVVLKKLLQGYYANDNEMKADLHRLVEWDAKDAFILAEDARRTFAEIKALENEILQFLDKRQGEIPSGEINDKDLVALALMDLAWRIGGDQYQEERGKFFQFVQDRPNRFTYYAKVALLRGNYADGLVSANRLRDWMRTADADLRLKLERWRVLLQAASSKPESFRDEGRVFSDWLAKFESEKLYGQPVEFWQQQERDFPHEYLPANPILSVFLKELQIREFLALFHALKGADDYGHNQYAQAKQAWEKVQQILAEIKSLDSSYAQALEQAVLIASKEYVKDIDKKVLVESGISINIHDTVACSAKTSLMDYICYRIKDAHQGDEWKKRLKSVLDEIKNLDSILRRVENNNDASQIVGVITKLLSYADIWRALGDVANQKFLDWLYLLPFPSGLDGVFDRLNAAQRLSEQEEMLPVLRTEIEKIKFRYIQDAFFEIKKLAAEQNLKYADYEKALNLYKSCKFLFQEG